MVAYDATIWMGMALLTGILVTLWRGRVVGMEDAPLRTALQVVVGGAAAGGLAVGLLDHLAVASYTASNFVAPPAIRSGLLWQSQPSAHGALLGGVLGLLLWGRGQPGVGWRVADVMAPGAAVVMAILWGGNLHLGQVYGLPDQSAIATVSPDAHGLVMARWPVPLAGAIVFGGLALFLWRAGPFPPGALAIFMLWAANAFWFLLGFFRDDPAFLLGPFRKEQFISLIWLGASAALLPGRWRARNRVEE